MELKAKYDCIVSSPRFDKDGNVTARIEHHHFTIGKLGDKFSGGIYIRRGEEIPTEIILEFPEVPNA